MVTSIMQFSQIFLVMNGKLSKLLSFIEVELLIGCGGFTTYQFLTNSECYEMFFSSEGMGAKVRVREGNNPDHQLRSQNIY